MVADYLELLGRWCSLKVLLWDRQSHVIFREGEIWWCSIGMNLGEESFGKGIKFRRPVLIFKKFTAHSFLGLPLTTQEKSGSWYVPILFSSQARWAMLNQARIFDKKRLGKKLGVMKEADFAVVKEKFHAFYCSLKIVTPPLVQEAGIDGQSPNSSLV